MLHDNEDEQTWKTVPTAAPLPTLWAWLGPSAGPLEGPLCCPTRASVQLERGVRIRLHNREGSLLFGSDLRVIVT